MATLKKKKAAAAVKKTAAKKPGAKTAGPAPKKQKSAKKVVKKAVAKKVASAKSPAKKSVSAKKTTVKKEVLKKVAVVKSTGKNKKPIAAKKVATKAKEASKSKVESKKPLTKDKKTALVASKASAGKIVKPELQAGKKTKAAVTPAVKTSNPSAIPSKATKAKTPQAKEQADPLAIKAQKAIRELEETMDLSKMRPRIQAGSPPLKPLVKKHDQQWPKLSEPTNTQKVKYQLEFEFRSSPKILFTSLSDSSGLAGWFADEVHTKDDVYTFSWEGGESYAKLLALRENLLVRFQWLEDAVDGTYFQFEIKEDDITADIALVITDFALPGEKDTNIRLWESQVQKLRMLLGSL